MIAVAARGDGEPRLRREEALNRRAAWSREKRLRTVSAGGEGNDLAVRALAARKTVLQYEHRSRGKRPRSTSAAGGGNDLAVRTPSAKGNSRAAEGGGSNV